MKMLRNVISLLPLALAATMHSASAAGPDERPVCTPELLLRKTVADRATPSCKDLSKSPLDLRKTKDEADGVLFNYALVGKREHRSAIENFGRNASAADSKRALEIAKEARQYAIDYITGKRDETTWSTETKAIVERIKALEFRISELSDGDCYDYGDVGYPQAAYNSFEHTIGICVSMAKTHSEGIFATIAHEIGHAVSSCNMKIPLVKYEEITTDDTRCLLGLDENNFDIREEDLDMETQRVVRAHREVKQGLDLDPQSTDLFAKCGRATRVLGSALSEVTAFKAFDACATKRFAKDYRKYVAAKVFHWDELPPRLSPQFQALADKFMSENPQSCYRKAEENFADTFSAHLVALRHAKEFSHRSPQASHDAYSEAVFDLTSTYCVGRIEGRNLSNPHLYPNDRDRVLTYFTPPYAQNFLNCRNLDQNLCTLPLDPASYTSPSTPASSSPARDRGRVR